MSENGSGNVYQQVRQQVLISRTIQAYSLVLCQFRKFKNNFFGTVGVAVIFEFELICLNYIQSRC